MDMEQQLDDETNTNFRLDLLSSLFGQQIATLIVSNPITIDEGNNNNNNANNTCLHPVFVHSLCTNCGENDNGTTSIIIPLWYIYPSLSLNFNEIIRIRDTNLQTLLAKKRLHLVLDLDHTLVHSRKFYKLSREDRKFLRTKKHGIDYNLPGDVGTLFKMSDGWTKLRPFVRHFLREVSTMFDMSIYTLGCKSYGWSTAKLLDPEGEYFDNWRVISREDCVSLDKHKKFLDVVLEHERVVVVMDDNESVWEDHKANLLRITPYNFFSYFSPEDKDHDASPPRGSWSQLNKDENEEDGVLARALEKLRAVHAAFYDDLETEDYVNRDVREVIRKIKQKSQRTLTKKQKKHKGKKVESLRALQAVHL